MRFFRVLLGTAITFLLASTFTTAMNPRTRLLRVAGTSSNAYLDDTEERGALSAIKNWAKVKRWVSADKSDAYVKGKLGLQNLRGSALTSHPNYKILQKFLYKREGRELDDWFGAGVTMHGAWMDLKLNTVNPAVVAKTDAYRTYLRYVTRYDDMVYNYKNGIFQPPVEFGGSPAELFAKVKVWSAADRPRWYVKEMLDIDGLSKSELVLNAYYKEFLRLTGKKP